VSLFKGFSVHEEKTQFLDYQFFPDGGDIIPVEWRSICREYGGGLSE